MSASFSHLRDVRNFRIRDVNVSCQPQQMPQPMRQPMPQPMPIQRPPPTNDFKSNVDKFIKRNVSPLNPSMILHIFNQKDGAFEKYILKQKGTIHLEKNEMEQCVCMYFNKIAVHDWNYLRAIFRVFKEHFQKEEPMDQMGDEEPMEQIGELDINEYSDEGIAPQKQNPPKPKLKRHPNPIQSRTKMVRFSPSPERQRRCGRGNYAMLNQYNPQKLSTSYSKDRKRKSRYNKKYSSHSQYNGSNSNHSKHRHHHDGHNDHHRSASRSHPRSHTRSHRSKYY